jgi:hypothetical protein
LRFSTQSTIPLILFSAQKFSAKNDITEKIREKHFCAKNRNCRDFFSLVWRSLRVWKQLKSLWKNRFQTINNRFGRKMSEIGTKTEPFKLSGPSRRSFMIVMAIRFGRFWT